MFTQRVAITASWVAVMDHRRSGRGILLSPHITRCLLAGDIHEFITCTSTVRSEKIDNVAYLGFAHIDTAGVISVGDKVDCGDGHDIRVLGFDYTHMPNHINILLTTNVCISGKDAHLQTKQQFIISGGGNAQL